MNVYDFDETILRGDSTFRFTRYCLIRHPGVLRALPGFLRAFFAYRRGEITFTQGKEKLLSYFRYLPNIETDLARYWKADFSRIKAWYIHQKREDDVVISASPEFLIKPACAALGLRYVYGTLVDPRTGAFRAANCSGEEKVKRLKEELGDVEIDEFYSDSHKDDPLARLAKRAYMVKGDRITPWVFKEGK